MTMRSELQYYSPGRCIYFWFGHAYGVLRNGNGGANLRYIGSEAKVKEALASGAVSVRSWVNELLQRERENYGMDTPQMTGANHRKGDSQHGHPQTTP